MQKVFKILFVMSKVQLIRSVQSQKGVNSVLRIYELMPFWLQTDSIQFRMIEFKENKRIKKKMKCEFLTVEKQENLWMYKSCHYNLLTNV